MAIGNAVYVLDVNPIVVDMKMQIYKSDLSALVPYYNDKLMTFRRTGFVSAVIWGPGKYIIAITRPYELAGKPKYLLEFRDTSLQEQGLRTIGEFGFAYSLALTPDASRLAIGGYNGVIVGQPIVSGKTAQWKASPSLLTFDGTKPLTFDGSKPPVGAVTWSPDGRYVAAITNPQFAPKYLRSQLAVWDSQGGDSTRLSLSLPGSDTILTTLAWSPAPTSTQLATGGMDGMVYLWDVNPKNTQGNALPTRTLIGLKAAQVTALAWSVDGRWLVAGYNDTHDSILIWKL
jgi:WD domain, G-beta repeat